MVRLDILSGSQAGSSKTVRRFPFHVGRAPDNQLSLDEPGIWDYHFMLDLQPQEGFLLQTFDQAFATVNDHPQASAVLRNGDVLSFGSVKMRFWLAAPVQRNLVLRESLIWLTIGLITVGQGVLIYFLLGLG